MIDPVTASDAPPSWAALARSQARVVTWQQLVALTGDAVNARRHVRSHRWQILVPGVYATFTGPVPREAWWWAVVLHAGPGAALGGEVALWLAGVREQAPERVEINVPHGRKVRPPPGTVVRSRCQLETLVQPALRPPRLRVDEAVLDVADAARRPEPVVDVVLAALQRRVTTPTRLAAALERRARHRWRALVHDLLADADSGVHSVLERRYLTRVERAHGLPPAERNRPRREGDRGRTWYPDLRYVPFRSVVELDGRRYHPLATEFRDRARDNRSVLAGEAALRYGWREVAADPCGVAGEVAQVLAGNGWTGRPHPCSPTCPVGRPAGPATGASFRDG